MPTRQEIAESANRASVRAARRRRFNNGVLEMVEHPDDLGVVAEHTLAEMLRRRGWEVTQAGVRKVA